MYGLEQVANSTRSSAGVSRSPTVRGNTADGMSMWIKVSHTPLKVGGVLLTVRRKLREAEAPSGSVTVTVIRLVPIWLVAGVTCTVRLVSEPPKTMFVSGTSTRLVESADSVRLLAGLCASPTLNERVVEEFAPMVRLEREEIVGAVFWDQAFAAVDHNATQISVVVMRLKFGENFILP